jgi:pimeloyl-ACP methyl ester carboxylesterase
MWGSNDRIVPPGYAQDWQEVLPHAELAIIPDGGHLLFDEFPAAVEALRSFLKS